VPMHLRLQCVRSWGSGLPPVLKEEAAEEGGGRTSGVVGAHMGVHVRQLHLDVLGRAKDGAAEVGCAGRPSRERWSKHTSSGHPSIYPEPHWFTLLYCNCQAIRWSRQLQLGP
jgi:hypothetical protein